MKAKKSLPRACGAACLACACLLAAQPVLAAPAGETPLITVRPIDGQSMPASPPPSAGGGDAQPPPSDGGGRDGRGGDGPLAGARQVPIGQAEASGVANPEQPGRLSPSTEQKLRVGRAFAVNPAPIPADDRQRTREGIDLGPAGQRSMPAGAPGAMRHGASGDYGGSYGGRAADLQDEEMRMIEEERIARAEAKARERERREMKRFRDELLDESIEKLLPLEPDEIRSYKRRRDSVESAVNPSPAQMRTETRQISAVPGIAPQTVRLTGGYASTVLFQDVTGAPWPVLSVVVGNPRAFSATQPRVTQETLYEDNTTGDDAHSARGSNRRNMEAGTNNVASNVINVVPLTNLASTNLFVQLEGAPYPVVLHLLSESTALDSRIDDALVVFRMDKAGPNAKTPVLGPSIPGAVSEEILSFVHGVAPDGAKRVHFTPDVPGVQMWRHGGKLYLRTMHQAVWPAWTASASGDSLTVYAMPETPSVVVSVGGKRVKMALSGTSSED